MPSPRLEPLVLTDGERRTLATLVRRLKKAQALATRAQIVLACAEGGSVLSVAAELGVSRETVSKWRSRFLRDRLAGLADQPRPGRPRKITDEQIELVITKTLGERGPEDSTPWSTRSMAAAAGVSQTAVSRIWRAFGLKPHLTEMWELSADLQLPAKICDVAGLYIDPPHGSTDAVHERKKPDSRRRPDTC